MTVSEMIECRNAEFKIERDGMDVGLIAEDGVDPKVIRDRESVSNNRKERKAQV